MEPKINLIETKQIIPEKNLFGQSNIASNAFNVIIQMATKPSRSGKQSRSSRRLRFSKQASKIKDAMRTTANSTTNINLTATMVATASAGSQGEDESESENKSENDIVGEFQDVENMDTVGHVMTTKLSGHDRTNSMFEGHNPYSNPLK